MSNYSSMRSLNVALVYGGGQIPTANYVMGKFASDLLQHGYSVYGIHKSFLGLTSSDNFEQITFRKSEQIREMPGTYFQTCRKFDPASEENFQNCLNSLSKMDIGTIVVFGGDGSLRAINDFYTKCIKNEYPLNVLFVPCTIDGMNGTRQTVGYSPCVSQSVSMIDLLAYNAFATWDCGYNGPRIAIGELQGRNRNDILIGTMDHFINHGVGGRGISQVNLVAIPTGYNFESSKLLSRLDTAKPNVILISEGVHNNEFANPGNLVGEKLKTLIEKNTKFKCNALTVGYLSQTNISADSYERDLVNKMSDFAVGYLMIASKYFAKAIINSTDYCKLEMIDVPSLVAKNANSSFSVKLNEEEEEKYRKYLLI